MKKIAISMFLFALVASLAGAQMMGGGGRMPTRGTTPGAGFGGIMNGFTGGMLGLMGGRGTMGPNAVIVTPSGNVIVTRATDSNGDGILEGELVALRDDGTKAWSASLTSLGFLLGVSGDVILAVVPPTTIDLTKPLATTLVAYDVESGNVKWQLPIDGIPMEAHPFPDGTYVTVVSGSMMSPTPGSRAGIMTAALWAIDKDGKFLWKYDLKQ